MILNNKENTTPFLIFTGSKFPPASYKFRYLMAADGWLAADILHRSFSRIELEVDNFRIKSPRLLKLLNYGSNFNKSEFHASKLHLKHGTDGPRIQSYLTIQHAENKRISSTTHVKLGNVGYGNLKFYNGPGMTDRNIRLRFTPDNNWTPMLEN